MMKKIFYLFASMAVVALYSCNVHPDCCVLPQPPAMTAEKNGAAWLLPIGTSTFSNNNIFVSTVGPSLLSTAKDSLSISLKYAGLGSYSPTDQQVAYTVFANGIKTKYALDTNFYNSINITELAVQTKPDPTELKVTFILRFVDPATTTSVTLADGKFTAFLSQ